MRKNSQSPKEFVPWKCLPLVGCALVQFVPFLCWPLLFRYFVGFYFFMGGMEHWCDWDWGGGERPGLPWAESFINSWRDHIISTSKTVKGILKHFSFPDWKCWLCLVLSLSNLCLMKSTCVLSAELAWLFMTMHLSAVLI